MRQPVHTVYGGAHLFEAGTPAKLGQIALASLRKFAPQAGTLAQCVGLRQGGVAETVYARLVAKLEREPVEDFRIDFEDGYGIRSDDEEDEHAKKTAIQLATAHQAAVLPPYVGLRIKPLGGELGRRSKRTLDVFIRALLKATDGAPPRGLRVTLPKVERRQEVAALARLLSAHEKRARLKKGTFAIELMVESPSALVGARGEFALQGLVQAAQGRCVGAHFGAYDYTSALDVTAPHQTLNHPACMLARQIMQLSLAGTGVWLSDGATTVLPVGPHRGTTLTPEQERENRVVVHRAWRLHYEHVRGALSQGFYQGWDLHPNQLPARYAAVYAFFLEALEPMAERLRRFIAEAARATLGRDLFDDAATGQGLLSFFLRGLSCGALTVDEAAKCGLSPEELETRSFLEILKRRQRNPRAPAKA